MAASIDNDSGEAQRTTEAVAPNDSSLLSLEIFFV
jgi:hypothetical protein